MQNNTRKLAQFFQSAEIFEFHVLLVDQDSKIEACSFVIVGVCVITSLQNVL
jgi:hypothetical protein